ncbi:MAG: hypothetical protein JW822_03680 [Spirochaetales bacterium]|nr:hypothetical protein [Spirochaetales bacterium]
MELKLNIIVLLPLILGVVGAVMMIPGSFVAADVAYEEIKDYAQTFGIAFYTNEELNERVRSLWVTIGFITVGLGLVSSAMTVWFPHGFGKALILVAVIAGFVTVAFNIICLIAVILFLAGGIIGMIIAPKKE